MTLIHGQLLFTFPAWSCLCFLERMFWLDEPLWISEWRSRNLYFSASSIELRRTIDVQGICDSMSLSVWPLVGCSEVIGHCHAHISSDCSHSTASAVNFHVWVAWTGSRLAWKKFGFWFESIIIPSVLTHRGMLVEACLQRRNESLLPGGCFTMELLETTKFKPEQSIQKRWNWMQPCCNYAIPYHAYSIL